MMNYFCNPINVDYRYQFNRQGGGETRELPKISREAADPSMVCYKGKYYIFASMTLGVWVSQDMAHWEAKPLPDNLPLYDYAPDVRIIGDYVYFSASNVGKPCNFYRTQDILNGPYEEIEGSFDFWDPNLFVDDDGRIYFYWGCSNVTPIWGVELEPKSMLPKTGGVELVSGNWDIIGYERNGEDHAALPVLAGQLENRPFIEGAWMDKYQGKYYLQYACPGAEYNTYCDGVYEGDSPLGPFTLARNNPYSYKPGGFIPGAGHGSTMSDCQDNLWHTATMRISLNHIFERRCGLWPAGFDADGELFCNQRYGDWPIAVEEGKMDPWKNPEWMLLSYGKDAAASSAEEGKEAGRVVEENVRTWWRAVTNAPGEWVQVDLGEVMDVRAVQVNFADDKIDMESPKSIVDSVIGGRYIEERQLRTRWTLEGSSDGGNYIMIEDKSRADTCLPHDLVVRVEGIQVRYLKLTVLEVPYYQPACISGLRVFGKGNKAAPPVPTFNAIRVNDLEMKVTITSNDETTAGYNILWGHRQDKLYHSYMIFGRKVQNIHALIKGTNYFVRVEAFNENGITAGNVVSL